MDFRKQSSRWQKVKKIRLTYITLEGISDFLGIQKYPGEGEEVKH